MNMKRSGRALGRGVMVLGVHRSGTSAVTGVIDALGLPACRAEDRFPVWRGNPRGNYESRSLSWFDETLLRQLGGSWWAPPRPSPGWAGSPDMLGLRAQAADLFAAAHPAGRWVWKDPRACVLLPFWDLVLGADMPRVVVLRNPLESAASLRERDGMPRDRALALAERSLRACLDDSAGRPVFITRYEDLLDAAETWCALCARFLRTTGLPLPEPLRLDATQHFLDPSLRHHRVPADLAAADGVSAGLSRLWAWAIERRGIHESLAVEGLPSESPATDAILRAAPVSEQP